MVAYNSSIKIVVGGLGLTQLVLVQYQYLKDFTLSLGNGGCGKNDFGSYNIPNFKRVKQIRVKTYVDDHLRLYINGSLVLSTNVMIDGYNIDKVINLSMDDDDLHVEASAINTGGPCEIRGLTLVVMYSNPT